MEHERKEVARQDNPLSIPVAIVLAGILISGAWLYTRPPSSERVAVKNQKIGATEYALVSALEEAVLPSAGAVLPVSWGNLGVKLASIGAIDAEKFRALYESRGQFTDEDKRLLGGTSAGRLLISKANSGYLLNLFWALGLASKNPILDSGEMANPRYGGAQNFASTAGWTLAAGNPMDHYSRHLFFTLTSEQQALVEKVSQGIFRPCCGNSTHFPDCNHGMAMLGLLELMASQGMSEQDMWKAALAVNSYWFPDTYLTIATYMKSRGVAWKDVNPSEMLGAAYSSAQGYARIAAQVTAPAASSGSGSGCAVGGSAPAPVLTPSKRGGSGCGI